MAPKWSVERKQKYLSVLFQTICNLNRIIYEANNLNRIPAEEILRMTPDAEVHYGEVLLAKAGLYIEQWTEEDHQALVEMFRGTDGKVDEIALATEFVCLTSTMIGPSTYDTLSRLYPK